MVSIKEDFGAILVNILATAINLLGIVFTIFLLAAPFFDPQFTIYAALLIAFFTLLVLIRLIDALAYSPIGHIEAILSWKNTAIKNFNRVKNLIEVKVILSLLVLFVIVLMVEVISLYVIPVSDFYLELYYGLILLLVIILWSTFLVFLVLAFVRAYNWTLAKIKRVGGLRSPVMSICGAVFVLMFLLTAINPEITKPIAVGHYDKSGYYQDIINKINVNSTSDVSKVHAILQWQNENMHNEYRNAFLLVPTLTFCITSSPPYTLFLRASDVSNTNAKWALISKYGACGEAAQAFMELANMDNVTVRCILLNGADHSFDQVYDNGTWMTIDAVGAVNGWENLGYDMPVDTYEDGWQYDIVKINAYYPNGTKEDITYDSPYMNVYNLTVRVLDQKDKPVSNASVWILSDNVQHVDQKLNKYIMMGSTDNNGISSFTLGQNNYTIRTNKNVINLNTTNVSLSGEDKNITVMLKFISNS